MAIPEWTARQSLAQPNVNPTAAIDATGRAFGNISELLQRERMSQQEQDYRNQQLGIQREQLGQQEARLLSQDKQFDKQFGLQEQQFQFNKGAGARAAQARIEEENRIRSQNAGRFRLFSDMVTERENAQLQNFTVHPDTVAALEAQGMSRDQINAVVENTKRKNADVFLDRNKALSEVMENIAATGDDLSAYAPLMANYQSKNGMTGASEDAVKFAKELALSGGGGGSRSSGGGSGNSGGNDANFARNIEAIRDEESFKNGSDSWYKDWFGGTKVYKEDVTKIAEHALANRGIRPMYIAQAIKADMESGQTKYNLSKISTNPNSADYQGILAAAEIMQQNAGGGAAKGAAASSGALGSPEFALNLMRGYQPVDQQQRGDVLLDESKLTFPDLFNRATEDQNTTPTSNASQVGQEQDRRSLIFSMAKQTAEQPNFSAGSLVSGPGGQMMPALSAKSANQKELAGLVRIMEQAPKPNVQMPDTPEYRLFPERWKDPNPAIDAENKKLLKAQEKAYEEAFKIFRNNPSDT